MDAAIQVVSLIGAGLILSAFVLLQRGSWRPTQRRYLWCNLLGGAALTAVAIWDRRAGFIVLEGAWAMVALWGLVRGPRLAETEGDGGR